jgi:hypothetical protein
LTPRRDLEPIHGWSSICCTVSRYRRPRLAAPPTKAKLGPSRMSNGWFFLSRLPPTDFSRLSEFDARGEERDVGGSPTFPPEAWPLTGGRQSRFGVTAGPDANCAPPSAAQCRP